MSSVRRDRFATIREKYLELLDGDRCAALVLDQMIAWQRHVDQKDGDRWFYKSRAQLADQDLFGLYDKSTVGRRLNSLAERGYLEYREPDTQPQPQTREWRVDIGAVNRDLREYRATVDGYRCSQGGAERTGGGAERTGGGAERTGGGAERTGSGAHNAQARSETTTETITETTTEARSASEHGRAPEKHPVVEVTSNLDPPPDQLQEGRLDPAMQFASEWKRLVGGRFEQTPENLKAASIVCDYLPASEVRQLLGRLDDIPKRLRWDYVALELEARTRRNAMLPLEFLDLWADRLNKRWAVDQVDRLRWVVLEHDRHEIADALEVTRDADSPGWRYFKAVLRSDGPGGESRDGRSDAQRAMDWAKNHPDYVGDA